MLQERKKNMTNNRPPSNRNGSRKPNYSSVPVKTKSKQNASRKPVGTKYNIPKRNKLPTPVIVTNILMICVILAVCGVVFAIAYNNIQYDKADASRNSRGGATSTSSTSSTSKVSSTSSQSASTSAVSSVTQTSAVTSNTVSDSDNTPVTVPTGEFSVEFFKDDLFIGDSIFTGLYGYNHIDRKSVAASVGYTAYGAQVNPFDDTFYDGSAVDYAKSLQPKHIIIMLGTNGLSPQTDMDDFKNGYRGLLNTLKSGCPDSVICVLSVPPITKDSTGASYSGITNTIIDNANKEIKSLCSATGVMYYDLNAVLKDSDGYFKEEYAEVDGMHFKSSTYPVLLSGVQKKLEQG